MVGQSRIHGVAGSDRMVHEEGEEDDEGRDEREQWWKQAHDVEMYICVLSVLGATNVTHTYLDTLAHVLPWPCLLPNYVPHSYVSIGILDLMQHIHVQA